jgi:integrase/recombinase XerD
VATLRSLYRNQVLLGARSDNPAAELDLRRRRRPLPRTLSPLEAERLIEAATGTSPRALRDRALSELLYDAGLCVSEAVGLTKADVHLFDFEEVLRQLKARSVAFAMGAATALLDP